jgi:leukotriene-A4 hydrolase
MPRIDPHSYFDTEQPRVNRVFLRWRVDFDSKQLIGDATLKFERPSSGQVDLDSRGLTIDAVRTPEGLDVPYMLGDDDRIIGRRLQLHLPANTSDVTITYRTTRDDAVPRDQVVALQWLDPAQTAGNRHPFLYSQCQPIHARTMLPIQDTPRARVTYDAEVTVPEPLTAVMSARPGDAKPAPGGRMFRFSMPQPIPPYLLALAVGHLDSRDLSQRARIWAEPETVNVAADEFTAVEKMIECAERLFGPYEWERYDMLVLPPAFPYGGMENPRITFLSPTVLAGDRSLVDVVAHELAHSWTGNLVTNASMEHFWLNEGFTTWAERRILTALRGEDVGVLAWAIGQNELEKALARFQDKPQFKRLRQQLSGIHPDDAFSTIPYEKGARFVVALEREVGRDRFDRFVLEYMRRFRFKSITTEEFLEFLEAQLPGTAKRVLAQEWLHGTQMPPNAPVFTSEKLEQLTALAQRLTTDTRPSEAQLKAWDTREVLVFLQHLPRQLDHESLTWLDANLNLTTRGNYEILAEWLTIAGGSNYEPVFGRIREVLTQVGRQKFLRPLFAALGNHAETQRLGREIYTAARVTYHSLSRRVVEEVIAQWPTSHDS